MARRRTKTTSPLGAFEGRDLVGIKVRITNAGDGLSKAMQIEPQVLHVGDIVYVVLEAEVDDVRHKRVKDLDVLERIQTLKAGTVTLVDESLVKDVLEAQRVAIEQAAGVERLDFGEPGEPPVDGEPSE